MSPSPLVSHILLLRRPAAVFVLLAAGLLVQTAAQATGQILSRLPPRTSASLPPLPRSYALTPNISLTLHANLTLSLSRATADSAAIMWRSAASPFVRLDTLAAFTIPGSDGMYHPHSSIQCSYTAAIVAASQPAAYQALSLTLALSLVDTNATGLPKCSTPSLASTNVSLTVAATAVSSQQIVMDLRLEEASPPEAPLCANISSPIAHESDATEGACRLSIAAAHNDADAIYGLGHQYSVWDLRGRMVPVLVSEQGIGRGLEPLTALLNTFGGGAGGNWHTTYAPIPFYVTAALQAVFANASAYMEFDFRQASQAAINVSGGLQILCHCPLQATTCEPLPSLCTFPLSIRYIRPACSSLSFAARSLWIWSNSTPCTPAGNRHSQTGCCRARLSATTTALTAFWRCTNASKPYTLTLQPTGCRTGPGSAYGF